MKKTLLAFTTFSIFAAPVAMVISCGAQEHKKPTKASPKTTSVPWTTQTNPIVTTPHVGAPATPPTQATDHSQTSATEMVPWTTQTNPIVTTPWSDASKYPATTITPKVATPPHVGAPVTPPTQAIDWTDYSQTSATEKIPWTDYSQAHSKPAPIKSSPNKNITDFKVTIGKEDAKLDGYLGDISHTPREFRIYDNGLFKIKIETSLVGPGKYFSSPAMADLEAKEIGKSINIGPAITDLPKGIQLLQSDQPNSLGGPDGVQVSESNKYGSADANGVKNEAGLVAHEYGHHETLWDFENVIGGSIDETGGDMRQVLIDGLKRIGYDKISELVEKSDPIKGSNLSFTQAFDKDFPTDYGPIKAGQHKVFAVPDYPFEPAEVATRMLNGLSFRTDLTAEEIYTPGKSGHYPASGGHMICFEPPSPFVADATIRHYSQDGVFGAGKDNSRIHDLIDLYEKEIFGFGKGGITLTGNANTKIATGLELNAFGILDNLDTLEVVNAGTGKTLASAKVSSFNSRMGFKDELVSNTWATTLNKPVNQVMNFKFNVDINAIGYVKVVGKDANGNPVDISMLNVGDMRSDQNPDATWKNTKGLAPESDHFYLSMM